MFMTLRLRSARGLVFALALTPACADEEGVAPSAIEVYTPPPPFIVSNQRDLTRYVDPMIGTRGSGNVIPGALLPHGMVRASPDTNSAATSIDAYEYTDDRIEGFTHLHLEGPGGSSNGYNQIRFTPTLSGVPIESIASTFSHDTEIATPGLYAVTLDDTGIRAELTATDHAAVHRYTFPSGDAKVVIDLGASNGQSTGGSVSIPTDRTIEGKGQYVVHGVASLLKKVAPGTADSDVYFHATFSRPMSGFGTWQKGTPPKLEPGAKTRSGQYIGAYATFDTSDGQPLEVRIGISLVSAKQARRNAEEELGTRSFDEVRATANDGWNSVLNRIQIDADEETSTKFYTALYHSLFQPANYTEVSGDFVVAAGGVRHVLNHGGRPYYTDDWCMWDTFHTTHPLGTIVEPEIRSNVVRSMLTIYQDGGWLPKCTWNAAGYSRVMTGNHSVSIIVDAWMKGLRDFDPELAWKAMNKLSMEEGTEMDGLCGYVGTGTPPEYVEHGYVGTECDPMQAAGMTLEYAYDDSCMAAFAADRGLEAEHALYASRAQNYRNHWNPAVGFMQPRNRDGSWTEPFDPTSMDDFNGFVEASSWTYSFFVPHDIPALVALMGGPEAFVARLDDYFEKGYFDASNEPSFHIPWLYNYAGAPSKTQALVRKLLAEQFGTGPDGLPGNDDSGAMSAWYVFGALGLYPVSPGDPAYQIAAPIVDRAVLHLNPAFYTGNSFIIETENNAPDHPYIQAVTLNGTPLERTWITHDEITQGGTLHIVLGGDPSDWGTH